MKRSALDLECGSTTCSSELRRRSSTILSVFMAIISLIALGLFWWALDLRLRTRAEYKEYELSLPGESELIRSGNLRYF
ncbi:hypothetical protein MPTK1_1g25190 [Marchantia polymorpha subsp. ruderalis]|uniref:Uncharacterized protein n=2 Tax=Marchantia polymorpha TaxID=3197 RepID=A0AAF6AU42_MARPO|nr:hypothetical protein MARPO_0061s0006 [Marchantia polymorpha]BBM99962.1 hypothetical protein Mp_1g25190 [Marchantia polymorpha subsp. ruderalis]|eukprot:PTQ36724.1 hypothetical protein MARPO_0061s0006 [Marchantia polymorpha]